MGRGLWRGAGRSAVLIAVGMVGRPVAAQDLAGSWQGLKLEAVKAQTDVLVVDKVERPTAN